MQILQTEPTEPNLPNQTYQTKPTKPNQTKPNLPNQTKPNLPNQTKPILPSQTYQTKPAKPNLPNQIKLAYQAYWTKPTKPELLVKAVNPGSVVPLAMFNITVQWCSAVVSKHSVFSLFIQLQTCDTGHSKLPSLKNPTSHSNAGLSNNSLRQRCQPPIFGTDICAKSESNPKCLRKSLHKTNSKSAYLRQNAIHDKTRVNGT